LEVLGGGTLFDDSEDEEEDKKGKGGMQAKKGTNPKGKGGVKEAPVKERRAPPEKRQRGGTNKAAEVWLYC
jgi:hypothetical protein